MIELFLEVVVGFLFEFLLQLVPELLFNLGWNCLAEAVADRPDKNPYLASFGYAMLGLATGGLSLMVFPKLFVHNELLRALNAMFTPIVVGIVMAALGARRERKGLAALKLENYAYGFIFAFGVALIRFSFGK